MIEIIGAETIYEKAKRVREELDRKEKERQEKASYEELKKAVEKIQKEINEEVDCGRFARTIWFEELSRIQNEETEDKWFYLQKGNITKIIEMFSIAGYNIKWVQWSNESYRKDVYGRFDIDWRQGE